MRNAVILVGLCLATAVGGTFVYLTRNGVEPEPPGATAAESDPAPSIEGKHPPALGPVTPSAGAQSGRSAATTSDATPETANLPVQTPAPRVSPPSGERTELWASDPGPLDDSVVHEVPAERIKADPHRLAQLQPGSAIDVYIPQTGRTLNGVVSEVVSNVPGVSTLDIAFDGLDDIYSMQVHRGQVESRGWVATPEGIFNVTIDAQTGEGQLVREADLRARWALEEDAVLPPIEDQTPPPPRPTR